MRLFKNNTLVADIRPGKNYFVLWPLVEERQKYAHQVAKKFEEMMNTDER